MEVFTERLSQQFLTIAPDLRGYGQSPAPAPFAMADHLADLDALLAKHGVQEFVILGWSLGGILAMELALRHPDRVKGLILVATSACPWGDHPRTGWVEDALTGLASLINLAFPGWQWNIDTLGKRSLLRYLVQQHTPDTYRYLARYAVPAFLQTSGHAHRALHQALRSRYDRLEEIEQVRCPSLVLAGECDRHINAASSLKTAAHLSRCSSKVYPQVAHLFPWEIPHVLLNDIQSWIAHTDFTPKGESDAGSFPNTPRQG